MKMVNILKKSFDSNSMITVVIRLGFIKVPTVVEREKIFQGAHCLAAGGHKGTQNHGNA